MELGFWGFWILVIIAYAVVNLLHHIDRCRTEHIGFWDWVRK